MKRFFILTAILLSFLNLAVNAQTIITTAEELHNVRNDLNGDYILANDIDLDHSTLSSETWYDVNDGWLPIGDDTNPFTGTFDGNGYKITNLYIWRQNEYYIGFFGKISSTAEIINLHIQVEEIRGDLFTGGIAGYSEGLIRFCSVKEGWVRSAGNYLGGITGFLNSSSGIIEKSYSQTQMNSNGSYQGGICGMADFGAKIENCYSRTLIQNSQKKGGIAGRIRNSKIINCYNAGNLVGGNGKDGIVYEISNSNLIASWNDYDVSGILSDHGTNAYTFMMVYPYSTGVYGGWDFTNIWADDTDQSVNDGYPYLIMPASAVIGPTVKWVDQQNGDDNNDGNTESTAYASLQHAINNSNSGDATTRSFIYVKDGTYGVLQQLNQDNHETAILIDGLEKLTIEAVAGHEPKIMPQVQSNIVSVSLQSCVDVIIDNIDCDQTISQFDNWHVFNSDNIILKNSLIEGGEDGFDFNTDASYWTFENNIFKNINTGGGDDVFDFSDGSATNFIITNNQFINNYRNILFRNDGNGDEAHFVITGNIFNGTTSQESIRIIGASDIIIINNVIMNSMQQGIYIDNSYTSGGTIPHNITIIHNTFYNNDQESQNGDYGEIRIKPDPTTNNIIVKNNIIHGNGSNEAFESVSSGWSGENHNLIFNTTDMNTFPFGSNTISSADPLFANTTPGSEYLQLQVSSPAQGMGANLSIFTDIEGNLRNSPPDIGAYENNQTPCENIMWVDANWTSQTDVDLFDNTLTWQTNAFAMIQNAVDAVCDGGTVNVRTGNYPEVVNVDKSCTIQAGSTPVIDGGFALNADNITLKDLTILNGAVLASSAEKGGIYILGGTVGHLIDGCTLTGDNTSGYRGIFTGYEVENTTFINNNISNWNAGIYLNPTANGGIIIQNNILSNCVAGIGTDGQNNLSILNNKLMNNDEGFGASNVGTNVVAKFNNIVGNSTLGGINQYSGGIIEATMNWWGDCSGPSGEGPGTGDAVSTNVNYDPWVGHDGGNDVALWLSSAALAGSSDGSVALWEGMDCNGLDAEMFDSNRQGHSENEGLYFASGVRWTNSDAMEIVSDQDVSTPITEINGLGQTSKSIYIVFTPAAPSNGTQFIFEIGGQKSGASIAIQQGFLVAGMWNPWERKFWTSNEPLVSGERCVVELQFLRDETDQNEVISKFRVILNGSSSDWADFRGLIWDDSPSGIAAGVKGTALRNVYYSHNFINHFEGTISDIIVENYNSTKKGYDKYQALASQSAASKTKAWNLEVWENINLEDNAVNIYPNPAKDQSTLEINMVEKANASIKLMTLTGRLVEVLHNGSMPQGMNTVDINAESLTSGVYNIIIEIDDKTTAKQIIISK